MKPLNCAATRRRLNAYHDRELGISEQIAVSSHLEWCGDCAEALGDMRAVSRVLQTTGHGRGAMTNEEAAAFNTAVVSRVRAERQVSLTTQVQALFEDMHLVYAGVGAAAAADLVERLLDVVSRARLEPAQAAPLSDLGRMVWWVEHATVRATPKPPEDLPLPSKKRAETGPGSSHIVRV